MFNSSGPTEFTVSAKNSDYNDFANSFFYVSANITTAAGADLAEDVKIAPECNFYIPYGRMSTSI